MYLEAGGKLPFYTQTVEATLPWLPWQGSSPYITWTALVRRRICRPERRGPGKLWCAPGVVSPSTKKGDNAVAAGAIATVVYNNRRVHQHGSHGLQRDGPFVSVTQSDGAVLKANASPVTGEDGQILYYEGVLTVGIRWPPAIWAFRMRP